MRSQKLRERGVLFEQQLARADSVASWLLSDGEIEVCLKEDGKRWLLGAGSYGKVCHLDIQNQWVELVAARLLAAYWAHV